LERLHRECHHRELETSVLRGELQTLATVLESAEKNTSELQAHHAWDLAKYHRYDEATGRIHQLLKRHVKESRAEVQQLRADLQRELRQLQERCQDQVSQCLRSLQLQSFNSGLEDSAHRQAAEDARRRSEDLEQQLAMVRGEELMHEHRLDEVAREEAQQKEAHSKAENALHAHRCGVDRILLAVGTIASGVPSLASNRTHLSGAGNHGFADLAMPELLVQLRAKLDASFSGVRESVEQAERREFEARLAVEGRREESLSEHRRAAASSAVRDLEMRRDSTVADLKRLSSKEEADLQEHAACLLQLDVEVREREAQLREAQRFIQDDESNAALSAVALKSLPVPSPDSIASWRSDAAEPLKTELSAMLAELDQLQRRYTQGWHEREKDWMSRCSRSEEAYRTSGLNVEMRLQQEASSLRLQVEEQVQQARESTQGAEQKAGELRARLRESLSEADDSRTACRLLQSECSIASEDEQHALSILEHAEAHHSELEQTRRRDRERAEQLELQARRQRERELTELRRAEVAEAARMRSFLHQTLSTISAAASLDESSLRGLEKWPVSRGAEGSSVGDEVIVAGAW